MQDRNAIFQKRQIARGVLSGKRKGVGSLAFGSELAAKVGRESWIFGWIKMLCFQVL